MGNLWEYLNLKSIKIQIPVSSSTVQQEIACMDYK
jgi:hypothetical protein